MPSIGIYPGEMDHPGGGSILIDGLVRHLVANLGHKYRFVVCAEKTSRKLPWLDGKALSVTRNPRKNLWERLWPRNSQRTVPPVPWREILEKNDVEFVLNLSPFECLELTVPFIQFVWDLKHRTDPWYPEFNRRRDWDDRETKLQKILPRAARVIVGTETGREEILRHYGLSPKNVCAIPLPYPDHFDSAKASQRKDLPEDFLFYPAQFWPHKNHFNLIRALGFLGSKYKIKMDLVLTGSDQFYQKNVQSFAKKMKLNSQIRFLGYVNNTEIPGLYRRAKALVYPSLFGPDNLPPMEALAAGCPAIVADIPGARDQLKNAVLYFDPYDPSDLAKKIFDLLKSRSRARNLVKKGFQLARKNSMENYVRKTDAILQRLFLEKKCWTE